MKRIDQAGTSALGGRSVKRLGYGAMQLAGPGVRVAAKRNLACTNAGPAGALCDVRALHIRSSFVTIRAW